MLEDVPDPQTIERIVRLCAPIFDGGSPVEIETALAAINAAVDREVHTQTEPLRAALEDMYNNHALRFRLNGICHCDACQHAERLLGDKN